MIKTLIVDDDIQMLDWLDQVIPWEDYGFIVTGRAKNGSQALDIYRKDMPELIITDITMPLKGGIDLIAEVKKINPDVKNIVLTCHEDFKLAQQALKVGVDDYIVKYSLTIESMGKILGKMKAEIDKGRAEKEASIVRDADFLRNRFFLQEKFITDIIEGSLTNIEDIEKSAKSLKLPVSRQPFVFICSYIDNYKAETKDSDIKGNLLEFSIMNIAEDIINSQENFVSFSYGSDKVITLFWDQVKRDTVNPRVKYKITDFHKAVKKALGINMSSCIYGNYINFKDIKTALIETSKMRKNYFYKGSGTVVTLPINFKQLNSHDLLIQYKEYFDLAMESGNRSEVIEIFDNIYKKVGEEEYEPEVVKKLFLNLVLRMHSNIDFNEDLIRSYRMNVDTFDSLKIGFSRILDTYLDNFQGPNIVSSRKEINIVLNYIEKNLSSKITCASMADLVHMNCSYFSRLFKSEVGLSFTDYMIRKRIAKATYFLNNTDLPIEEITKEVGLEQPSYFYKLYKKVTGKTPGEVRLDKNA